MKRLLFCFVLFVMNQSISGQVSRQMVFAGPLSYNKRIKDSIDLCNKKALHFFLTENETDKVKQYARHAMDISQKENINYGVIRSPGLIAAALAETGKADSAMIIMQKLTKKVRKTPNNLTKAWHNAFWGLICFRINKYKQANNYTALALELFNHLNDPTGLAFSYRIQARIFLSLGDYEKAIELLNTSNSWYAKTPYEKSIYINQKFIGRAFILFGKPERAIEYYISSLSGLKTTQDVQEVCYVYTTIADYYIRKNEFEKAKKYQDSCMLMAKKHQYKTLIALSYNNFGEIQFYSGQIRQALKNYQKALDQYKENNDFRSQIVTGYNIARAYMDISKYNTAGQFCEYSLNLAKKQRRKHYIRLHYQLLSRIYEQKEDYREAYRYLHMAKSYNDSILNIRSIEKVALMEIKYETEKKEREIEKLLFKNILNTKEIQKQRQQKTALIFAFISVVGIIVFIFIQRRKKQLLRQELKISRAEIEARKQTRQTIADELHDDVGSALFGLKLNLEAHQFANKKITSELIHQTITQISRIYEKARSIAKQMRSPIADDVPVYSKIGDYIRDLQQGQSFNIDYTCHPPDLKNFRPAPYIEHELFLIVKEGLTNAVRHANPTNINVNCRLSRSRLNLLVKDDGKGFEKNAVQYGSGLKSMKNRIKEIKGRLQINSSPDDGTTISIEAPLHDRKFFNLKNLWKPNKKSRY